MNLFLIDKNENVIGVIPDGKIIELNQTLEINQADVLNATITLDKSLNFDDVRYFAVPDRDNPHNLWMYRKTIIKIENDDILIQGVNAFYDDLKAYGYIKDKRPNHINADQAVRLILDHTRWNVDYVDTALNSSTAEIHDTNFYYLTYLDSIKKIEDEWTVEIQPFINIEGNKITRKYINLYQQMGGNTGKRFVYGKSALEIVKESNDTDVYTALIGRGSGVAEQDDDGNDTGGYSRKINFADVEWSKDKGDPMDKPLGQEWIEWPQATKEFGYSDGTPRFGIVEFENEEDPTNLLKETWQELQKSAIPAVQFSATVGDVGFLNLGETVAIVRYDLDIKYQTRVIKIDWNRKNEQASQITLGDKLVQTAADRYRSVQSAAYKARDVADQAAGQANFAIDNGGTTVEWGSNEPKNPKEGTIWYDRQPDGTVVMKKYENGQWVILIDDTTGEQIKNKVDKAEEDVKQLKVDTDNAQAEINGKLAVNDVKLSDFNNKLSENDKKLNDFDEKINSNSSSINKFQNDLNENDKKIDNLNSDISAANDKANHLQDQISDVDNKAANIQNTADSAITIANDAKNGLLTKVDSSTFSSSMQQVDNAIQSKVSSNDFNTRVTQLDNAINTKVNSDTFYSEITQLSNGISSTVKKIDGLQIGGTNLLPQTKTFAGWVPWGGALIESDPNLSYKDFSIVHLYGTNYSRFECQKDVKLEKGKQYTISAWIRGLTGGEITVNYFDSYGGVNLTNFVTNKWERYSATFTAKDLDLTFGNRRDIEAVGNWQNVTGSIYVAGMKLEEGNVATDWSPSPDDLATQSQITQLSDSIQTKVSDQEFESKITQLSNGIQSNVNQINNLNIGGTNLLKNTKTLAGTWVNNSDHGAGIESNPNNQYKDFTTTWAIGAFSSLQFPISENVLEPGKTYTVSAWLRGSINTDCDVRFYSPRSWAMITNHLTTEWKRYHVTFVASETVNPNGLRCDIEQAFNTNSALYVAGIKVEEGNVATDWSPSPDDLATSSQITQLSDSINTKVSNQDFISKTNQLADGISSTVQKIDNIRIGGTNLLPHSKNWEGWYKNNEAADFDSSVIGGYKDFVVEHLYGNWSGYSIQYDPKLVPGNIYTISAWIRGLDGGDLTVYYYDPYAPETNINITDHVDVEWKRYSKTFVAQSPVYPYGNRRGIEGVGNWGNVKGSIYVAGIKLEEGNVATDWSPSPNDLATQTQITQLSDSIQTKVSDQEFESKITQLSNGIQSNVDSINWLHGDTSSQITQLNNSINTKVSNDEYQSKTTQLADGIQSNVNNINGLRDSTNSQITQLNNSINTKVSNADFISKTNQLADGISSTVQKVDGIQVGGTNLLPHSKNWDGWNSIGNAYVDWSVMYGDFPSAHVYASDWSRFELDNPDGLLWYATYTSSVWVRGLKEGDINIGYYDPYNGGLKVVATHVHEWWQKIKITFDAQPPVYPYGNRRDWEAFGNWDNVGGSVYFAAPKLEAGNVATAWSPDPHDLATQSQITQLSDNINMRVQKNDIVNQINISNEGILIDGSKTHITGQTVIDNAAIKDAAIDNLSASKLTVGVIDCRQIDVLNIAGYQIMANQITADKMAANAIMVGLNNSLTNLSISPYGLTINENGNNVLVFNKTGIRVSDPENNEEVGWIHANHMVDASWFNGLQFDLDPVGDYVGWGIYNDNTHLYDLKIAYYKNAYGNHEANSFYSGANVSVFNSVRTGKLETLGKGILNFQNAKVNGAEDAIALRAAWGAGCGFYIAGDHVYVKTASSTYDLDAVIHSIGRNQTWN